MAFHTVWSVDLGKSSLKAVKLRRDRNNIEILAVDKVDYPVSKNGVDAATQAKEALGIFRARNEVKEPLVVCHPGQGTFYRAIKVPATDEKKVDSMVGYEASQQIPFPLDEVIWDYHVVQKEYLPGEEREVALFAVRREAIDDFLLDFQNEEMAVEQVSIGYLGLLNFVLHDIRPEEPCIVLDIGAAHTDLVLVDGDRFWIRPLPHSGSDITKAISQRFKLDFAQAEKLKIDASTPKAQKQAVKIFQAVIQPKLRELVGEIHRSVGYYRSQAGEVKFKHLYLLGNGAKIIGIKKFLEEQLGVQVHRVQSINHFRVSRGVNLKLLQANLPSFSSALGAGLQALDAATCDVDLVPREEKIRKELGRKKKHAFIAAGILLAAMLVASFLLRGRIGDAEPIQAEGQRLVKEVRRAQGALEAITGQGGELEIIERRAERLEDIAAARSIPLDGIGALEKVLAPLPNGKPVEVEVPESDTTKADETEKAYLGKGLKEHLWVPWLRVTETYYPQPEDGASGGSEAREAPPGTVPAYRFRAFVVIRMRDDLSDSNRFIQERLAEPLAIELKDLRAKGAAVNVEPGKVISYVFHDPARSDTGLESPQEGGEFYGAEVSWLLRYEDPPAPEGEEDAGESAGAD